MQHDAARLITLLEKRLHAFEALASEITLGQQASVALDLEALRASDAKKETLCAEICGLDREASALYELLPELRLNPAGGGYSNSATPEVLRRLEQVRERNEWARSEAGRRNLVYAEFLARSRATVNVMMNVVSHCLGVYAAPVPNGSARFPFARGD